MHSFSVLSFGLETGEEIGKPDSVPLLNKAGQWSFLLAAYCYDAPATEPGGESGETPARYGLPPIWSCSGWGLPSTPDLSGVW